MPQTTTYLLTRRQVMAAGGAAAIVASLATLTIGKAAWAGRQEMKARMEEITGGAKPKKGRISITVPAYTEYAKQVHTKVEVDSPMTEADHVKTLYLLGERNTVPDIATYRFTPASGRAVISTRIRVAQTQIITAVAEMKDGSLWIGKARCRVAAGAGGCG
ncbi:MAG: thiosulfate oxidation carrier protein SoxY [Magnetospiraceae bacterium]